MDITDSWIPIMSDYLSTNFKSCSMTNISKHIPPINGIVYAGLASPIFNSAVPEGLWLVKKINLYQDDT